MRSILTRNRMKFTDNTNSYTDPDFGIIRREGIGEHVFWIELKEKFQSYNIRDWGFTEEEEPKRFIIDTLSVNRLLITERYTRSGIIIKDNVYGGYYFASKLDLMASTLKAVNRLTEKSSEDLKGKYIIRLDRLKKHLHLKHALSAALRHDNRIPYLRSQHECYTDNLSAKPEVLGSVRTEGYWQEDLQKSR